MLDHRFRAALCLLHGLLRKRGIIARRGLSVMAGGEAKGLLGSFFDYMERLCNCKRSSRGSWEHTRCGERREVVVTRTRPTSGAMVIKKEKT